MPLQQSFKTPKEPKPPKPPKEPKTPKPPKEPKPPKPPKEPKEPKPPKEPKLSKPPKPPKPPKKFKKNEIIAITVNTSATAATDNVSTQINEELTEDDTEFISTLCGNHNIYSNILKWLRTFNYDTKISAQSCIIAAGPTSIGKSYSINSICNYLNYDKQ